MGDQPLSLDEVVAAISLNRAQMARIQAEYYALIRDLDSRPGIVPRARIGDEARVVLREVGVDTPAEDVRVARALRDLPQLEKAFAAGEATRGQVKVAETALRTIRKADPTVLDGPVLGEIDTRLTEAARDLTQQQFKNVSDRIVAHLHPNAGDTLAEQACERRELVMWKESDGWTGLSGHLPPDIGGRLWATMDRWAKPHPAKPDAAEPSEDRLPIPDRRSRAQRQADALGLALGLALGASVANEPDRPHVLIHVREDSPDDLSRAWIGKYLCDATVQQLRKGPRGEVLNLGRRARTAPPMLRHALIGRDRTCVIPHCTVPGQWAEAHHVRWWEKGGTTDVGNMAMVCRPHHTEVHAGTWVIEMRHGIPWVRPPKWLDPEQRWRRNTQQEHLAAVEQLTVNFDPPP